MRRAAVLLLLGSVSCAGRARVTAPENRISCAGPHTLADSATGRLQGRVSDAASDGPLAGVEVSVESRAATRVTTTDADGRWRVGNLVEGDYTVVMRRGARTLYATPVHLCPEDVTTLRTPLRD